MALKQFKPNTPGQRGLVLVDRSELWKGDPEKSLTEGLTKKGGRNNTGRITARRRGGGHKRLYRQSTLSVGNSMSLRPSSALNMIPTARRLSRCCLTKTVRRATFWRRSVSMLVTQ